MDISVSTLAGKTITLKVEPSDTVESIKTKIQEKEGTHPDRYTLLFNDTPLTDDFAHDAQEGSTLYMERLRSDIQVFVKTPRGKTVTLEVEAEEDVDRLKEKLNEKENVSPDKQWLVYDQQLLKDGHPLSEYGVQNESSLSLIVLKNSMAELLKEESQQPVEQVLVPRDQLEQDKKRLAQTLENNEQLKKELAEMSIRLKVDDLREVLVSTADAQNQWEEIGTSLGLPPKVLEKISEDHSSVARRHYEMLRYWITKRGGTWEGFATTLKDSHIAKEIKRKHVEEQEESGSKNQILVIGNEKKLTNGDSLSEVFAKDVDWRVLGVLLGLSDSALENIQSTSSSEEDRQQEMVKCWISTECAYWSVLVDQLKGPVLNKRTLATSLAKTHLGESESEDKEVPLGTIIVKDEEVEKMKLIIANVVQNAPTKLGSHNDPVQPKGIMFAFGMTEVEGVDKDLETIRKTFQGLRIVVHRIESVTSSQLAAFIKAAATYDGTPAYPPLWKYICFYFGAHGGIDKDKRPYFKPIEENGEKFYVHENVLSYFKHAEIPGSFLFFFDCCLSPEKGVLPSDSDVFKLDTPRRCLVAQATYTGERSSGDKDLGGRWTHCLCNNLTGQEELGEILARTHKHVMEKSAGTQPPQFHSCVGPVYLNGMPKRFQQSVDSTSTDKEDQNILKKFQSDLAEAIMGNDTNLTSLATLVVVNRVIDTGLGEEIKRKGGKKGTYELLNALESKVDQQPKLLPKVFRAMEGVPMLQGYVDIMKGQTNEDMLATDVSEEIEECKKREEQLKQEIEKIKQETDQKIKELEEEKEKLKGEMKDVYSQVEEAEGVLRVKVMDKYSTYKTN